MNVSMDIRLKKANIKLIRHPETCLYGGVILMGETSIVDDEKQCPTAYTDGYNKRYGRKFLEKLTDDEIAGLVLHETLHVMLRHIPRHRDLARENARLANMAMDYVVNDIINNLQDKTLAKLPDGGLYDPMFHDWSVRRVYEYLKQEQDQGQGGDRGDTLDEHGESLVDQLDTEGMQKLQRDVDEAIHQGGMLAGKFGTKIPRVIKDLMQPEVDWREVLQDFWTSSVRGADELTWRKFNKRRVADEYYLPSPINESVGEVILAIDTSGSINESDLAKVAAHVQQLCDSVPPDRVRVLWWDTQVHGEQLFDGNYTAIAKLLKPMGGGGTRAGCVSDYITKNKLSADCLIMFTDGYIEWDINWRVSIPSLWIITESGRSDFTPPSGQKVILKS